MLNKKIFTVYIFISLKYFNKITFKIWLKYCEDIAIARLFIYNR